MEQVEEHIWELAHKDDRTTDTSRTIVPTLQSIFNVFVNRKVLKVLVNKEQIRYDYGKEEIYEACDAGVRTEANTDHLCIRIVTIVRRRIHY